MGGGLPYRCANCGSERVAVDSSRPSLDDRYAIGRCLIEDERADKAKRKHRPAQLVREDVYEQQRARMRERATTRRRAAAAKAVSTPGSGNLSKARIDEGREVVGELYG